VTDFTKLFSETELKVKLNSLRNLVVQSSDGYYIDKELTIRLIQIEIMSRGPVVTTFRVYKDFEIYWKYARFDSVYIFNDIPSNYIGGHAVVITGWSTEIIRINNELKNVRCWEVRNSWGTEGGDLGYFKVAFSTDVPINSTIQFDIPKIVMSKSQYNNMVCSGGVISFEAGDLPESIYDLLNITKPVKVEQPPTPEPVNIKNNLLIFIIIGGCVIVLILFSIIYRKIRIILNRT
jgi:hypothetical protein